MTRPPPRLLPRALAIPAALAATPAFAHPGHGIGGGFGAGILHPLTGWDHVLAMLLIGAWIQLLSRAPRTANAPAVMIPAFLAAMFAGFASGALFHAGAIEWAVTASVIVAAMVVVARWRAPLPVAAALVAIIGFAHGQAHGFDVPGIAPIAPFALGFLAASTGLLVAGLLTARLVGRHVPHPGARQKTADHSLETIA